MNGIIRSHGEFRLLWIGETASRLGSSVTTIVLPLVAATTLHASAFTVSALAATAWLPWLLLGLHVGPFVDRHHRRRLMIASDLASAVLFLSVPAAAALGILTTAQLLVVAFSAGCVSVVFTTAYAAFIVDLIAAPNQRAAANGLLQGSASAVQMVGPGIGGVLAQLLGAVTALLTDSLSFIVSLLCLLRIRDHGPRERGATNTLLRRQIGDGLRFIRSDPLIRPLTLFGGTANLALVGYQSLLVVFLLRTVGLQPGHVGVLLAIASCGGLAGAALGNRLARKLGSGRALLLTKVGACPCALLIPLAAPGLRTLLVPIGGFAVGLGIVAGNVISSSFGQVLHAHRALLPGQRHQQRLQLRDDPDRGPARRQPRRDLRHSRRHLVDGGAALRLRAHPPRQPAAAIPPSTALTAGHGEVGRRRGHARRDQCSVVHGRPARFTSGVDRHVTRLR